METNCPKYNIKIQEDCLFLNVWTPKDANPGKKLPVMVFIHGGAFQFGSGAAKICESTRLSAYGDIVVVTINYRLGILGFLVYYGDPEKDECLTGNYGLMDQALALLWVQENINAFGGDPDNVTLFGESAGASSVGFHLMMENQKSYNAYNAAIMESNPYSLPFLTAEEASKPGKLFIEKMGGSVSNLRKKEWDDITKSKKYKKANEAAQRDAFLRYALKGLLFWKPVICDKHFKFHTQPIHAHPKKPVIVGINKNEGVLFVAGIIAELLEGILKKLDIKKPEIETKLAKIEKQEYKKLIGLLFRDITKETKGITEIDDVLKKDKQVAAVLEKYPPPEEGFISFLSKVFTDVVFTSGNIYYEENAVNVPATKDLFTYYFTHVSFCKNCSLPEACFKKVCHSAELPYVFHNFRCLNCLNKKEKKIEYGLSNQFMSFWTTFAKKKQPGSPWKAFSKDKKQYLEITTPLDQIKMKPVLELKKGCHYSLWKPIIECFNDVNHAKCKSGIVKAKDCKK
jgi:carboxylesterase type B